jgi:hypothetical protein
VLFTLIACVCIVVLSIIKIGSESDMQLIITVPENLNFTGAFDEVFEKYTVSNALLSVKTANMGSLFKLTYRIKMKNVAELREFIDDLRVRNGNLEVNVMHLEGGVDEL